MTIDRDVFDGKPRTVDLKSEPLSVVEGWARTGEPEAMRELLRRWGGLSTRTYQRFNPKHDMKGRFATGNALGVKTRLSGLDAKGKAAVAANLKAHGVTQKGIEKELESSLKNAAVVADAKRWYPDANKYARGIAKKHGVSLEQAVAIISAVSPRTPWPRNQVLAERVLSRFKDFPASMAADEVAARIGGGFKANLTPAVKIARGESIDATLTGVKRRSFYNNILKPGSTDSVTVDTWMQRAVMRSSKNEMDLETSVDFINASKVATGGVGAGYISIADATRAVATRNGLSPDDVQSAYWITHSGSMTGAAPGSGRSIKRFNPKHDPKSGKFASGHGGGVGLATSVSGIMDDLAHSRDSACNPDQVDALMNAMADGSPANLAHLQVRGKGNQNLFSNHMREIARIDMPQLPKTVEQLAVFSANLKKMGVTATLDSVDPRVLRATQNQLNSKKVGQIYHRIRRGDMPQGLVLIISSEGAVLDGHHRWAAASAVNASGTPLKVDVLRVNLGIDALLKAAHEVSLPRKGIS